MLVMRTSRSLISFSRTEADGDRRPKNQQISIAGMEEGFHYLQNTPKEYEAAMRGGYDIESQLGVVYVPGTGVARVSGVDSESYIRG